MYPYHQPTEKEVRNINKVFFYVVVLTFFLLPITGLIVVLIRGWDNTPRWFRGLWGASIGVVIMYFVTNNPFTQKRRAQEQQVYVQQQQATRAGVADSLYDRETYLAALEQLDNTVEVEHVKTFLENSNWTRQVRVDNNSNWPLRVMLVYWDITKQLTKLEITGNVDHCLMLTWGNYLNYGWLTRPHGQPEFDAVGTTREITFQRPNIASTYSCPHVNPNHYDGMPSTPMCVVLYPLMQSTFTAVEKDGNFPPKIMCT